MLLQHLSSLLKANLALQRPKMTAASDVLGRTEANYPPKEVQRIWDTTQPKS